MKIKNQWVVHELRDNLYFCGIKDDCPVLEPLNSRVRLYKSERAANCAIPRILEAHIECCDFTPMYIEYAEVPDITEVIMSAPAEAPSKKKSQAAVYNLTYNDGKWDTVTSYWKIAMLKKTVNGRCVFGVVDAKTARQGYLHDFGADGGKAWEFFCECIYKSGVESVKKMMGEQLTRKGGMRE